jgi:hypothetical protein
VSGFSRTINFRPNSAGSTASAPSGIGAPVITRTASPARTDPSNGRPGIESPITVSDRRL